LPWQVFLPPTIFRHSTPKDVAYIHRVRVWINSFIQSACQRAGRCPIFFTSAAPQHLVAWNISSGRDTAKDMHTATAENPSDGRGFDILHMFVCNVTCCRFSFMALCDEYPMSLTQCKDKVLHFSTNIYQCV
jgi:hypothetical protein